MIPYALLILVPVALGLDYAGAGPTWIFLTAAAAVAVLADWVRRGTEQMAKYAGPSIGGLLNVTFGSIADLIVAIFVLLSGQIQVAQAQITGSIIATSLLGLGRAAFVGGIGRDRQRFSCADAGLLSTLLVLLTIALVLPAVFEIHGAIRPFPARHRRHHRGAQPRHLGRPAPALHSQPVLHAGHPPRRLRRRGSWR